MWPRFSFTFGLWLAALTSCAAGQNSDEPWWPREYQCPTDVTFKIRGRIDTDAIWTTQSAKNVADFGELGDSVGLRRARIGAEGHLPNGGHYIGEIDLASGDVVIRDLYIGLPGALDGEERVGHYREPFSLEGAESAKYFAFMERSPINVLDPARNWGVSVFDIQPTDDSAFAIGMFYGSPDQNDLEGGPGSTAGVTMKLTSAPINENDGEKLLHFGAALAERIPLEGVIAVNQEPRSPLIQFNDSVSSPFVPTIVIPANFQHILNVQGAVVSGPFWTQTEWYGTFIDQTGDGGTVFYHGSYVSVGYFLTGEHREYTTAKGFFGRVRVKRPFLCGPASHGRPLGYGAWEVAARLAYLDFFDPDTPRGPDNQLVGIQLLQPTFGVNWYLTDRVRLMFNYTYAEPDLPETGTSSASVFGTRLGVFW
jgi:phosphate-selective porin OprO/OprP